MRPGYVSHPKADWPAKPPARVSPLVGGGRCAAVLGPVIQPAAHMPSPLMPSAPTPLTFFPARPLGEVDAVVMQAAPHRDRAGVGFRRGDVGTHTSRTIMLAELGTLFDAVPAAASEEEIAVAIRQANCLGTQTAATRRSTRQRLAELYGLDPHVPVYRVLRRLWQLDVAGRPLLALLVAVARDPLLAASAAAIVPLAVGADFARGSMKEAILAATGDRISDAILDKVVRNAASSWTQSGHLAGRTIKVRRKVVATPATAALALYLAHAAGFRGQLVFASGWTKLLDADAATLRHLALEAKRAGLIDVRMAGDIVDTSFDRLDPGFPTPAPSSQEGVA